MRTIRIYQPGLYLCGDSFELSANASQHIGVVLRMRVGESLILFTGDNKEYAATITEVHKKKVFVSIDHVMDVTRESPRIIHLAQAISKGERMELVVQKAVELGVASITPLLTKHSVVKLDAARLEKKQTQWQAIAIAACEQSGRNKVPAIHSACSLEHYLKNTHTGYRLILDPEGNQSWRDHNFYSGDISLLIGPEGGFSSEETSLAKAYQFKPWRLGPRILRTETAAITALSVLQAVCGDL